MGIKLEQTPQRSSGLAWIVRVQLPREEASQHRRGLKGQRLTLSEKRTFRPRKTPPPCLTAASGLCGGGVLGVGVSRSRQREPKLVMALLMAPVTP